MKTYILIMIFTTGAAQGGISSIQQEFLSLKDCEVAKVALARAHGWPVTLRAQGCFEK